MTPFKEWYERKYGCTYPGEQGEFYSDVFQRLAEAFAVYVDEIANLMTARK
jgi:hypothetical protein